MRALLIGAGVGCLVAWAWPARGATYSPGFEWTRATEFDAGTGSLTTNGNPNTDAQGTPVWFLEHVPRGQSNNWYRAAGTRLVWDPSWFGGTGTAWVRINDTGPRIVPTRLEAWDTTDATWSGYTPMSRWVCPVTNRFRLRIQGALSLFVHSPAGAADWSVVRKSGTNWTRIAGGRFAFPSAQGTTYPVTNLDWRGVIQPGDEIRTSVRPVNLLNTVGGYYMYIGLADGLTYRYDARRIYDTGFVWNRAADYDAGESAGSTQGNPNTDGMAGLAWFLERVPRGSSNDWYKAAGNALVWDASWYGSTATWVRSDDFGPRIDASSFGGWNFDAYGWADHMPLVRWVCLETEPMRLRVHGTLRMRVNSPAASADWLIARKAGAAWTTIAGARFAFPDSPNLTYPLGSVEWTGTLQPGDEIRASVRPAQYFASAPGFQCYTIPYDDSLFFEKLSGTGRGTVIVVR